MLTHDAASTTRGAHVPLHANPTVRGCVVSSMGRRAGDGAAAGGDGDEDAGRHGAPAGEDVMRAASTAEQRVRALLQAQGHAVTHEVDGSFSCAGCAGRGWIDRRGVLVADHPRSPLLGRCPRAEGRAA